MEAIKKLLADEKRIYIVDDASEMRRKHHKRYMIWKYLYYFRLSQHYLEVRKNSSSRFSRTRAKYFYKYYERKKYIAGEKAGIEIGQHCKIGSNLNIWHSNVVINGNIGDGCIFHGNNIIGNKGNNREMEIPTIGNHVDIGAGAVIIGDIRIADNCIIGAGAVVTKSFLVPGSIIVGVPSEVVT